MREILRSPRTGRRNRAASQKQANRALCPAARSPGVRQRPTEDLCILRKLRCGPWHAGQR